MFFAGPARRFALAIAALSFLSHFGLVRAEEPASPDKPAPAEEKAEKSGPLIPPSKETTYFTEPLDEEGYVDILAAANKLASEGVTPENNAAVLLWQVYGPQGCDEQIREQFFEMMGTEVPPEEGDYLVSLEEFGGDKIDALHEQLENATQRIWTAKDFPELAAWLEKNEKPLALAVKASQRPNIYEPLVAPPGDEHPMFIAVLLPGATKIRDISRALNVRALLRAGEGDFDGCREDLAAIHHLARLAAQGRTLINILVGIAIEGQALQSEGVIATQGKFMAGQYRQLRKLLAELPPMQSMHRAVDTGERLMFVDCAMMIACGTDPGPFDLPKLLVAGPIDWNETLRYGNTWYDRIVEAMKIEDYEDQQTALGELEDELQKLGQEVKSGKRIAALVLTWGPARGKLMGRMMGEMLMALLLPAVTAACQAEHRSAQQSELTQIALSLAAHRAESGEYPKTLDALVPDELAKIPTDRFSGKVLIYQRDGDGFVLYSVGKNGVDDHGKGFADDGDDLVIKTP